ncbi:MAG: carboxypeptidase regulatory-like domain-containing protein [Nitrospirae bacterium]|nr:carboxypeptidase regulatory-like domain-containing protein [Nitrospirota bacterium]
MGSTLVRFVYFFVILLIAPPALATHEIDHRYIVFGYVSDDQGHPLSGKKVTAIDTTIQLQESAYTDSNGYYEVLLHLHDSNNGDSLEVWVEDQKKEARITFDPGDKKTDRRRQVDFGAPASGKTGAWIYWLLGGGVAGFLSLVLYRVQKKKKKAAQKRSKAKSKS